MQASRSSLDRPIWISESHWSCRRHIPSAIYPAAVERCCYSNCLAPRPSKSETHQPNPKPWPIIDDDRNDDYEDLMKWSVDRLRKYAANELGIKGASKIPGGKATLVNRILQERKRLE